MKLTIELVPSTSWCNNVRSQVSKSEWDRLRKTSYKKAGYKCEICGDTGINQGYNWPVECHEIWEYNDEIKTQTLKGLISLCPHCHKTKHVGLAEINNELDIVLNQLVKINDMTLNEASKYISQSFEIWRKRSQHNWNVDISIIK